MLQPVRGTKDNRMSDSPRLEVLHDHYKESFSYIREREKERDRLFLILIALFALLALEIQYPINFKGAVGTLSFLGIELNVDALPLPAFLTATWVTVLVITLRYCQASTNVERQYKYLHMLEDKISAELQDDELYRREGKAYKRDESPFRWWVRRFYVVVLPVIAIIATGALLYEEWTRLEYPLVGKLIDLVSASGVAVSIVLYRIVPLVSGAVNRLNERPQSPSQ
jgi:hypothetical protein